MHTRPIKNVLIRHRPKTFTSFLGNGSTKNTLAAMFAANAVPPGFLLTGPAGCGKSTLAYLLIRRLRCESVAASCLDPCGICAPCTDDLSPESPFQGEGVFVVNCSRLTRAGLEDILGHARYAYPILICYFDEAQRAGERIQDLLVTFLENPAENAVVILSLISDKAIEDPLYQRLHPIELSPPPEDALVAHLHEVASSEGFPDVSTELLAMRDRGNRWWSDRSV